jgi:hypothetical protein
MGSTISLILLDAQPTPENAAWWTSPHWWLAVLTLFIAGGTLWLAIATQLLVKKTQSLVTETKGFGDQQLRQQKKLVRMQLLLELNKEYEGSLRPFRQRVGYLVTSNGGVSNLYDKKSKVINDAARQVLDFFETVGYLVEQELLEKDDVWHEFGTSILSYYHGLEAPVIQTYQQDHKDPSRYTSLGSLYKAILLLQLNQLGKKDEHQVLVKPDADELENFWARERSLEVQTYNLDQLMARVAQLIEQRTGKPGGEPVASTTPKTP